MSLRLVRPARISAVAVVVLASMSAMTSSDDTTTTVAGEDRRVIVQHRESRFATVWPQAIESSTTLVSRRDRDKKVRVDSPRGGRVWTASDLADHDVPEAALTAYQNAAHALAQSDPGCRLPWTLLAAIGRVESSHGRFAGSVLSTDGVARPEIIGVALNGVGPVAAISDSDGGKLDGDTTWDRAVGPMQFIPTTWAWAGRDGDGDGDKNPHDMDDAALAAGDYLCAGTDVSTASGMKAAIFRYNPSDDYVRLVRAFERGYSTGVFEIPSPHAPDKDKKSKGKKDKKDKKKDKHKQGKKDGKKDAKKDRDRNHKGDDGAKGTKGGSTKPTPEPSPSPSPSPSPKPKPKPSSPSPQPGQPSPQQPGQPSPQPNPPAQQDPTPNNPSPTTPSPSNPSPSNPDPSPSQPSLQLEPLAGVVGTCGTDWCVGTRHLDLGPVAHLAAVAGFDYDGDGAKEPISAEMEGLVLSGTSVTLQVRSGSAPAEVYVFDGHDYRLADGTLV